MSGTVFPIMFEFENQFKKACLAEAQCISYSTFDNSIINDFHTDHPIALTR